MTEGADKNSNDEEAIGDVVDNEPAVELREWCNEQRSHRFAKLPDRNEEHRCRSVFVSFQVRNNIAGHRNNSNAGVRSVEVQRRSASLGQLTLQRHTCTTVRGRTIGTSWTTPKDCLSRSHGMRQRLTCDHRNLVHSRSRAKADAHCGLPCW